jgi:hypothetical protein
MEARINHKPNDLEPVNPSNLFSSLKHMRETTDRVIRVPSFFMLTIQSRG